MIVTSSIIKIKDYSFTLPHQWVHFDLQVDEPRFHLPFTHSNNGCFFKNWLMLSVRISSYVCTGEVWRARKKDSFLNFLKTSGQVHSFKQKTTSFCGLWADKPRGMLVEHEKNS